MINEQEETEAVQTPELQFLDEAPLVNRLEQTRPYLAVASWICSLVVTNVGRAGENAFWGLTGGGGNATHLAGRKPWAARVRATGVQCRS